MTGLPCVCIFEKINSLASSAIRQSAGCSQLEEVNVVKLSKDFKSGDFLVFVPSHRKLENRIADLSVKAEGGSESSKNEGATCNSESVFSIEMTSQVERGKFSVKFKRPLIYKEALRQTLFDLRDSCDRCMHFKGRVATINCLMLNDFQKDEKISNNPRQPVLHQLRQLLVAEHVIRLLQSNGFQVSAVAYPISETVRNFIDTLFGTDVASKVGICNETDHQSSSSYPVSASDYCNLLERCRRSPCAIGGIDDSSGRNEAPPDSSRNEESEKLCEVTLDLRKYLTDNIHQSPNQSNSICKNLDKISLNHNSSVIVQIAVLENHRIVQALENVGEKLMWEQNSMYVHISSFEKEFHQHVVNTVWRLLEPKVSLIKQVNVVCGPVSGRGGAGPQISAQGLFDLRHQQMKDAFLMKHGTDIEGNSWKQRILSLTRAAVKFEMLSTICRQEVKLCLSDDNSSGGPIDSKGGVFVMYNFARLSTLFLHFEEAVARGIYPALADFDSVDFALLKQEEEWGLLFNFILLYPNVLRETVSGLDQSSCQSIQTHKICQFLLSLSSHLSIYYSKTHILCESRPHLMQLMFARLYLMKGIHRLMSNCFNILGVDPCSRL